MSDEKQGNFEATLRELERVVAELENGELTLADQLVAFENGIKLAEQCRKMLDEARLKVTELTKGDDVTDNDNEVLPL